MCVVRFARCAISALAEWQTEAFAASLISCSSNNNCLSNSNSLFSGVLDLGALFFLWTLLFFRSDASFLLPSHLLFGLLIRFKSDLLFHLTYFSFSSINSDTFDTPCHSFYGPFEQSFTILGKNNIKGNKFSLILLILSPCPLLSSPFSWSLQQCFGLNFFQRENHTKLIANSFFLYQIQVIGTRKLLFESNF